MKSLYKLTSDAQDIAARLLETEGEITPAIELAMSLNEMDISAKIDAYGEIIDRFALEAEYWKKRKEDCDKMLRAFDNAGKRMKDTLKESMIRLGTKRVEGDYHGFTLSGSQPSLVVDDEKKIPEEYFVETVVRELNKVAVKETLKEGIPVEGARLETGFSLRRSLSKKEISHDKKD